LSHEAEGETDHLVTTSNHHETVSLRFRELGGSTVLCESV
jgi:hypothetical protein